MAKGDIQVQIKGDYNDKDINRAIRDLNALKTQAGATAGPMASFGNKIGESWKKAAVGLGLATVGLASAKALLVDSAKAAAEDEQSLVRLNRVLGNLGMGAVASEMRQYVDATQQALGVSDSLLRSALIPLVTATKDSAEAQRLMNLALDISAAGFADTEKAAKALALAATGNTTALSRLRIPMDQAILKSGNLAKITEELARVVGGSSADAAATAMGRYQRFSEAVGELQESLGYGLINALDAVDSAMGGQDGAVGAMSKFGKSLEDAGRGIGYLVEYVTLIPRTVASMTAGFGDLDKVMSAAFDSALSSNLANLARAVDMIRATLDSTSDAYYRMTTLVTDATIQYRDSEGAIHSWVDGVETITPAAGAAAGAIEDTTEETVKLVTAMDALKASIDRFTSRDDLTRAMRDMGKAAREAKGDIRGNSDANIALREELGKAATAALGFAQTVGTSAQDTYNIFTAKVQAMKDNLIANKVSPRDAERWVNKVTWLAQFQLLADAIGKGPAAEAMRLAGMAAGKRAWQGIVQGLRDGQDNVATAAGNVAAAANRGAQAALDAHSPSRVWRGLGLDATKGFELGLEDGTADLVSTAADLIAKVTAGAAQAAKQSADSALDAVRGVSDGIVSSVLGNVGFSLTDAEGNALTPEQIVQSLVGSIANQQQAVSSIAANIGKALPPALLQQVLAMPPDTAVALANYLGANPALLEQLTLAYDALGVFTEEALGVPMGLAWGKVGEESAADMLQEARTYLRNHADSFARFVGNTLAGSIPFRMDLPGRANGGPVAGGAPYIVGERGPELFVPSTSGSIVPNGRSVDAGAKVINITVNAPVGGDLRRAGQDIAEALAAYERGSGPIYVKAS